MSRGDGLNDFDIARGERPLRDDTVVQTVFRRKGM